MIFGVVFVVVLLFGLVVFFGAPYLPTMKTQTNAAIDLLDLDKGSTIIELGSGDGRVAKRLAAAGYKVVGYELNPILVIVSILWTWKYRKSVKIILGNFWNRDWPQSQGIYVFLLDRYMAKLDKKIQIYAIKNGSVKVASFTFKIVGQKQVKQNSGVRLYTYR